MAKVTVDDISLIICNPPELHTGLNPLCHLGFSTLVSTRYQWEWIFEHTALTVRSKVLKMDSQSEESPLKGRRAKTACFQSPRSDN